MGRVNVDESERLVRAHRLGFGVRRPMPLKDPNTPVYAIGAGAAWNPALSMRAAPRWRVPGLVAGLTHAAYFVPDFGAVGFL
jgi:hypothetical protein